MERHSSGRALLEYPYGVTHGEPTPLVAAISLGKRDGLVIFNNVVLHGRLAGFVKAFIEYTKVRHIRETLLGRLIWEVCVQLFVKATLTLMPVHCALHSDWRPRRFGAQRGVSTRGPLQGVREKAVLLLPLPRRRLQASLQLN